MPPSDKLCSHAPQAIIALNLSVNNGHDCVDEGPCRRSLVTFSKHLHPIIPIYSTASLATPPTKPHIPTQLLIYLTLSSAAYYRKICATWGKLPLFMGVHHETMHGTFALASRILL